MNPSAQREPRGLLFLCSGNVLRSAFCELYAKHRGLPFRIHSAGTQYRNRALFPESRAALQALGVAAPLLNQFRPRHIEDFEEPVEPNSLVFGMTHAHLARFTATFGDSHETRLMLSVLGREEEVADPYLTGDYTETFEVLTECINAL